MKATYISHMGDDLQIVNAARVSFSKTSDWVYSGVDTNGPPERELSKADKGLIGFLARGCTSGDWDQLKGSLFPHLFSYEIERVLKYVKRMPDHWTPFGHTAITLHIRAPIFVARQLGKHQVGFVWNEVSRRYVEGGLEFYFPDLDDYRSQPDSVKQGSGEALPYKDAAVISEMFEHAVFRCECAYNHAIKLGLSREQARMVLPQSMFTEWYWTGNLYSFANVFIQRTDSHAQSEVQDVARQIGKIIEPLFPVSWPALTS